MWPRGKADLRVDINEELIVKFLMTDTRLR